MKTSNKILLFIGLVLLISPFINAYSLRQKLVNNEYTLWKERKTTQFEPINIIPTDSIHIIGGNELMVKIIQSDSASIVREKNSDVYIHEENGVIKIQNSNENSPNSSPGLVTIKTPSIKAISFEGKLIVDSVGNQYRNTVSKYYSSFTIRIQDFKLEQMNIRGLNGGGSLHLSNNRLNSLSLEIGEESSFHIDEKSYIDSMKVTAARNSFLTFIGTRVKSLQTTLDPTVALTLKGVKVTNIIPYE